VIDAKRQAKSVGNFFVEPEHKVAFAIRIKGINKLSPQCKKIMQLLRLRQLHNGVFVRLNKATINMLRKVEPYIAYGYPSRKVVTDLLYKRGFGKVNGQRIPLTDNSIVEGVLGSKGIISVEDVIHEIVNCGPNFKETNHFLWPFKLNSPRKGFELKRHPYHNKGAHGNREDMINELVKRML
jgi:large subunit ribosomal protein L7e